jgi:hypothetical protein
VKAWLVAAILDAGLGGSLVESLRRGAGGRGSAVGTHRFAADLAAPIGGSESL